MAENEICERVRESLSDVLDGSAPDELFDHIADCDSCRDLRHDAERAVRETRRAGEAYRLPPDMGARVLGALGESRASEAQPALPKTEASEPQPALPAEASEALPAVPKTDAMDVTPEAPKDEKQPEISVPKQDSTRAPRAVARRALVAAGAVAAIGALFFATRGSHDRLRTDSGPRAFEAKVERLARAGARGALEACDASGSACRKLEPGMSVPAGSRLRTDFTTRADLTLGNGDRVVLDRSTELFLSGESMRARLFRGNVVVTLDEKPAGVVFELPKGSVTVRGTKFALAADDAGSRVDVARGSVTLAGANGESQVVHAGETGRLLGDAAPVVSASESFGSVLAWSEERGGNREKQEEVGAAQGLGELRAKKPGQDKELSSAVTLASHKTTIRVAGAVARTEIEEVFQNHTDDVLEGIFRFPLPPDAKIERLALEVDGKLEEGAFVDRDRAAKIFRGAIATATPKQKPPREEIVWVPGPWKDPALLEWQRGGRFELRIFPIPKRASRRVILAYTEVVKPSGGLRRFTYPLAYDPSGSLKVGQFELDLRVLGHDVSAGARAAGYPLVPSRDGDSQVFKFSERDFVPRGDLTLEYALPGGAKELRAFTYRGTPMPATAPTMNGAADAGKAQSAPALEAPSPYVAFAIQPKLPRALDGAQRELAIVVDSSRSMLGESYRRASDLAARVVRELDPGDRVTLFACDADCTQREGGPLSPGSDAARSAEQFYRAITPDGGSDPVAAVRRALASLGRGPESARRIVYIGDGAPTVGEIRPGSIERAVRRAFGDETVALTSVAVGADADTDSLSALARGGRGVLIPHAPGRSASETAYAVLGASYGSALSDVEVELPSGLHSVAPRRLDSIAPGGELLLAARMDRPELQGDVILRGKVNGERFEQRYPVRLAASDKAGNAFVPRLFAALRLSDLERDGSASARDEAVALSSRFNVQSRFTSLLVLESAAMFKAFGLDNTRTAPEWSGEEQAEAETVSGELEVVEEKPVANSADDFTSDWAGSGSGRAAGGMGLSGISAPAAAPAPARTSAPRAPAKKSAARLDEAFELERERPRPPRMIPMRKVWKRIGAVEERALPKAATAVALSQAEREYDDNPNRRESLRKFYTALMLAGDVERAGDLAQRWTEREPLDPDAITARADVAARRGNREAAMRILGGVVDVRPSDIAAQKRLARLYRWLGANARGCRHSVAIAELRPDDAKLLAEAVRCSRETQNDAFSNELLANAAEPVRRAAELELSAPRAGERELRGDLRAEASWSGGADLDIAFLTPDGHRVSFLGAPTRSVITARDVASSAGEGLALSGAPPGEYLIELVRRTPGEGSARGELTLSVAGTTRRVPFVLDSTRTTIALARISMRSELVPLR
jgi:tetratricopeptide (TPR) repeat protein